MDGSIRISHEGQLMVINMIKLLRKPQQPSA